MLRQPPDHGVQVHPKQAHLAGPTLFLSGKLQGVLHLYRFPELCNVMHPFIMVSFKLVRCLLNYFHGMETMFGDQETWTNASIKIRQDLAGYLLLKYSNPIN